MNQRNFYVLFILYFFLVSIIPISHCHADELIHQEAATGGQPAKIPTDHHHHPDHESIPDDGGEWNDDQSDFHFHFIADNLYSSLRQSPIDTYLIDVVQFVSSIFPVAEVAALARGFFENQEEPPILRGKICAKRHSGLSPPLF